MQFEELVRKCFAPYINKDREIPENLPGNNFTFNSTGNPSLSKIGYLDKNVTF